MRTLLFYLDLSELVIIAQSPVEPNDMRYEKYSKISKVRQDYANTLSILTVPFYVIAGVIRTAKLLLKYDIRILISTGSDVAIVPSVVAKIFGARIIFMRAGAVFLFLRLQVESCIELPMSSLLRMNDSKRVTCYRRMRMQIETEDSTVISDVCG